jgi:hypothetical protein
MSISITDPPANQVLGGMFTVQGNYYCPVGNPNIQCNISPAAKAYVYLTYVNSTWEAYFSGVPAGNYIVNASISHPGETVNASPVNMSVSATPPVTINSPKEGDTIAPGGYTVSGTVPAAYTSGYKIYCSLTGAGVVTGPPVSANPDQNGNWSVLLPISPGWAGFNKMNVNVQLIATNTNAIACEEAVGSLTISS